MIAYIRSHLGWKVLLSYLAVILVGAVVLTVTIGIALPQAYGRHLSQFDEGRRGLGAGGAGNQERGSALFTNFQTAVSESLTLASLAATFSAVVVSVIVTQRWVKPIRAMTASSDRIARGKYQERVQLPPQTPSNQHDEIEQLAVSFNKMAERLEQTEAIRQRLLGDVAHELRTPLSVIQGSMEALLDGVLPAEPATYQNIYRETERLKKLVSDLGELSRVEARADEIHPTHTPVEPMVARIVSLLEGEFTAKGVELGAKLAHDLPDVLADRDRINQVLMNLVGNALQHTPEGGRVEIAAVAQKDEIRIAVRDTGAGISAEHLPHLFERFYRADTSRARASGGSGIGLTIAKYLVEAHGGRIWAESPGPGQGATFNFTLPRAGK